MSGGKKPESSVPTDQTCVVSTVAGDGTDRCRDGIGTAAHLDRPSGLVRADDGKSLVFTETGSGRVRSFDMTSGIRFRLYQPIGLSSPFAFLQVWLSQLQGQKKGLETAI